MNSSDGQIQIMIESHLRPSLIAMLTTELTRNTSYLHFVSFSAYFAKFDVTCFHQAELTKIYGIGHISLQLSQCLLCL